MIEELDKVKELNDRLEFEINLRHQVEGELTRLKNHVKYTLERENEVLRSRLANLEPLIKEAQLIEDIIDGKV